MIKINATGWVSLLAPVTKEQLEEYVGQDCGTYDKDCPVCSAYASWRKDGHIELLIDAESLINWVISGQDMDYS